MIRQKPDRDLLVSESIADVIAEDAKQYAVIASAQSVENAQLVDEFAIRVAYHSEKIGLTAPDDSDFIPIYLNEPGGPSIPSKFSGPRIVEID